VRLDCDAIMNLADPIFRHIISKPFLGDWLVISCSRLISEMSRQENQSTRNAIISGVFLIVAACITGVFVILNTAFEKGFIISGPTVQGGNPIAPPTNQSESIPTATPQSGPTYKPELCGDAAYEVVFYDDNGIKKTNMTFTFPKGYPEGFVTSDPGLVEFSDGQVKVLDTQFTLITSGFSSIKINGVDARQEPPNSGNWGPNSYGCVFFPQDAHKVESSARADYQIYVDANIKAVLYRVTPNGFELLASNK
jgi:hypothetical protein